jgi:PAB1-binding protein PBP1
MLDFDLTNNALKAAIGKFNVATLHEIDDLHLYDFGIYLDLEPEEEEKAMLEQNIQMALQQNQIYLEDAIDIREIRNLTLANQVLKYKRVKKQEADQQAQMANIQAQADSNSESSERASMQEVQKGEALAQTEIQIEQAKSQMEIQRMQQELQNKQQLMAKEFEYNMKLKQMEVDASTKKEAEIEDRKDKRTKIQASQQSQMITQRQTDGLPTDFENNMEELSM